MVGGGTTENYEPNACGNAWLERLLQVKSRYQRLGEEFYRTHHPSNSLYIEITREGLILAYDGWDYKRGLERGKHVHQAEFERFKVPEGRWWIELASIICFARRVRKQYDWNVIPVLDGLELRVKTRKEINKLLAER